LAVRIPPQGAPLQEPYGRVVFVHTLLSSPGVVTPRRKDDPQDLPEPRRRAGMAAIGKAAG